jgi:hypothetical protein
LAEHHAAEPNRIDLVVFSALFPSAARPGAGLFIRERMFRVAQQRPLAVVSPQPWFPGQSLIRLLRPGYRPQAAALEIQQGPRSTTCGFCVGVPPLRASSTAGRWRWRASA